MSLKIYVLVQARALSRGYEAVYPAMHPVRGLHYALLAKLEAHLGDRAATREAARRAWAEHGSFAHHPDILEHADGER